MEGCETKVKKETARSKLKKILEDGQYHKRAELIREIGCKNHTVLNFHMTLNRRELADDEAIICELVNRTIGYRKIKLYKAMQ